MHSMFSPKYLQYRVMDFGNLAMLTYSTVICQHHVVELINFLTGSSEHTFCSIYEAAVVSVLWV